VKVHYCALALCDFFNNFKHVLTHTYSDLFKTWFLESKVETVVGKTTQFLGVAIIACTDHRNLGFLD
jgi:hypothetical protein